MKSVNIQYGNQENNFQEGFIYMVMHRLKVEIFKNLMKRKEYWYFLFIQSYENKAKYIKVFVQGCYN